MKFELSKSTVQCSHQDDYVSICVEDPISGIRFLELEVSFEDFGKLIGGSRTVECKGTLHNTKHVGQVKIRENRTVKMPKEIGTDRVKAEEYILKNCQEVGWYVYGYLGSRNSFNYIDGEYWANYSVYKYLGPEKVNDA